MAPEDNPADDKPVTKEEWDEWEREREEEQERVRQTFDDPPRD